MFELIFVFFTVVITIGHVYVAYGIDKGFKNKIKPYEKYKLNKIRMFFAFYNHKSGEVSKASFWISIRAYILTLIILIFLVLSATILTNIIMGWLVIALIAGYLLLLVATIVYYDFKHDIPEQKNK